MNNSHTSWLRVLFGLQVVTVSLVVILYFDGNESGAVRASGADARPESTITWLPDDSASSDSQALETERIKAALRDVLNEELADFREQQGTSGKRVEVRHVPPGDDPDPGQQEAVAISKTIMQQAISDGVWSAGDTETLLPYLGVLNEDQRMELVDRLHSAINRQELALEDVPPL